MNPHEHNDRLSAALRQLEAGRASPGFTDGVLAGLPARDAQRRRRRSTRLALATGAVAIAAALGILWLREPAGRSAKTEAATRAAEIREEYRLLSEELDRLQRVESSQEPLLYLGASDEYDLVLDLAPLLDQQAGKPIVPAMQDLRARPALVREAARREP